MNRKWWVLYRFTSCLELIRDNFRNILFSMIFLYKSYTGGDFYESQGWLIKNHRKYVVVLCSTRASLYMTPKFHIHPWLSRTHIHLTITFQYMYSLFVVYVVSSFHDFTFDVSINRSPGWGDLSFIIIFLKIDFFTIVFCFLNNTTQSKC